MPDTPISREELKRWLDEKRDLVLIDTSLESDFRSGHLPDAQNACVFEMTFLDQVKALRGIAPDPAGQTLPIVVYGSSRHSLASADAVAKLTRAGYRSPREYREGLADWREAGLPLEGDRTTAPAVEKRQAPVEDRLFSVVPGESQVIWTGRNVASEHQGTVAIASGRVAFQKGRLAEGKITLDMTAIENLDLQDAALKNLLIQHLKSDDFFDVGVYPEAVLTITSAEPIPDATPGTPNYRVQGQLRLKEVERALEFPALIDLAENGTLTGRANFDIDRTLWNVRYGSGKFYERLGMHLVCDLISLDIKIVAR